MDSGIVLITKVILRTGKDKKGTGQVAMVTFHEKKNSLTICLCTNHLRLEHFKIDVHRHFKWQNA